MKSLIKKLQKKHDDLEQNMPNCTAKELLENMDLRQKIRNEIFTLEMALLITEKYELGLE